VIAIAQRRAPRHHASRCYAVLSRPRMPSYRHRPIELVLDVRSHVEFWLGHLDGATCIPVGKLADAIAKRGDVTPETRILVYCASGARSAVAVGVLESLGYRHVTDGGSMSAALVDYAR
jgi:phage shock protein E